MKCLHPIHSKRGVFRCGKCLACKSQKVNEFIIRFNAQNNASKSSFFVTLSYDNDNLPLTGVSKMEMNLFLKRLKNVVPSFKYVCIGEYGGRFHRPHYHLNIWFENDFISWTSFFDSLKSCWKFGNVDCKSINDRESNYIAKYHATNILSECIYRVFDTPFYVNSFVIKNLNDKFKDGFPSVTLNVASGVSYTFTPRTRFIKQLPHFRLSSHGIGESWLYSDEFKNIIVKNDYKILNNNKQKCSIPRYYVRKMDFDKQISNSLSLIRYMLTREKDRVDLQCEKYEQMGLDHDSAYKMALDLVGSEWLKNYEKNVIERKSHGNENIDF